MPFKQTRAVIITRPDGSEHEYASQLQASKHEPIAQNSISKMCRLGIKCKGYSARFKSEE